MEMCGFCFSGSEQELVWGFCEQGDEPLAFIKCVTFLEYLSYY